MLCIVCEDHILAFKFLNRIKENGKRRARTCRDPGMIPHNKRGLQLQLQIADIVPSSNQIYAENKLTLQKKTDD